MGKTKGELVSDLELRLTKGKPSDDIELERSQIAHWLDIAANTVLADALMKEKRKFDDIDAQYIKASDYISPVEETLTDVNAAYRRFYIPISTLDILPFRGHYRDYGIVRINNNKNQNIVEITYDDSDFYKNLWFASPSCNNIQWYREGGKVFLDGIDSSNAASEKFRLFYVAPIDSSTLEDTDEYPLADNLLSIISDLAEEIGRKQIYESIADLENDGKDI